MAVRVKERPSDLVKLATEMYASGESVQFLDLAGLRDYAQEHYEIDLSPKDAGKIILYFLEAELGTNGIVKKYGHGSLPLPINSFQSFRVYGGPYAERPNFMAGVKLAAEISASCTVSVPTRDFSTPSKEDVDRGLWEAVQLILLGRRVYVGCKGGQGRTGLFLALLAKAFGIQDPVDYVRKHYMAHAVETKQQEAFVAEYQVPQNVVSSIKKATRFSWLKFWKSNLTVTN